MRNVMRATLILNLGALLKVHQRDCDGRQSNLRSRFRVARVWRGPLHVVASSFRQGNRTPLLHEDVSAVESDPWNLIRLRPA